MAESIILINWFTESSKLIVSNSSNQMASLAGSGLKMEEDHLNIKVVTALLFIMLHITYCVTKTMNLRYIPMG